MADLNIINGTVFINNTLHKTGLSIDNGKIVTVGKNHSLPPAEKIIDASGQIVLPGAIDVHTHILDLDYAYRENYITGTKAASSGGVTTLLEMPLRLKGKSALQSFDTQINTMNQKSLIDFGVFGSAGYTTIDIIPELAERGCCGFKTFMINPPEEEAELQDLAAKNDYYLLEIFSKIARTGKVASVHAENDSIITGTIEKLQSADRTDFAAHTESRPVAAEDEACARALMLAYHTDVKLNLVHISSKNSFFLIKKAKQRIDVTCEITPHHLFLTDKDGKKIGPWAKVDPPLRSRAHVESALKYFNDSTIDMVASDHSPYGYSEKENNNIFECGSGTPGVETMLPVLLDAVNKKKTTLTRVVEAIASNPAQRFGLSTKGKIAVNADADFVLVNMNKEYTIRNQDMYTTSHVTIFDGKKIQGKIEKTIVRGTIVYDKGEFQVDPGYGIYTG